MITEYAKEKLADAARDILYKEYANGEFVFDPILVETKIDAYGDEYPKIYVIYDGDMADFHSLTGVRLSLTLDPVLDELEISGVSNVSLVPKFEWEEFQAGTYYESE